MPIVHGPACFNATVVGPAPHLPEPRYLSVADGTKIPGTMPKIILPGSGFLGEKNRLCVRSPNPVCSPDPPNTSLSAPMSVLSLGGANASLWWTMGRIVREITSHFADRLIGITGWMFAV